jgi:glycosyltransferase involved in cell wall biosynthesis
MTPLFSIITVTFNAHAALRETARSIESQTFRDFEWIVIDGGSTDGTTEFLSTLRTLSHWVSEKDEGIADAWNKGISKSRGSQILLLNAGDTYASNMLESIVDVVDSKHITCAHTMLVNGDGQAQGVFRADPAKLWRGMHIPHNWASVPATLYRQHGPYRKLDHAMDFDWFHRYYKRVGLNGFRVVDQVLGTYLLGGHSDKNYKAGFEANRRILVENGSSSLVASSIMWAYSLNHWFRHHWS